MSHDHEAIAEGISNAIPMQLNIDDIAQLTATRSPVRMLDNAGEGETPFAIIPDNHHARNLEEYLPAPVRIRERRSLLDVQSFIDYYRRFETDETVIFASHHEKCEISAVFDYHGDSNTPAWSDHRAYYTCPRTNEWKAWWNINDTWLKQMDFAEFIENQLADVREPTLSLIHI